MLKSEFIENHMQTCQATKCRKYDNDKVTPWFHSLEYSRRKCAKNCWKKSLKNKIWKTENGLVNMTSV